MRAGIYDRVSKDLRRGRSVAEQSEANRAACAEHGWTIVVEYQDNDRSASRYALKPRENWPRLLGDLEGHRIDVLVLWEQSRGDRRLEEWAALLSTCRQLGILIHITQDEYTYDVRRPRDWKTLAESGVASEHESEQTRARILRSVASRAAQGAVHGRLPYGYRREYDPTTGELLRQVPHEEQAAVIQEAARRIMAGETTYAVACDFNARRIPTPRGGGAWSPIQIKRLCTNPRYIAKRVHRGVVVADAQWPAILDEVTHYTLVRKLTAESRWTRPRESAVRHLLSGIATGACGGRVRVQKARGFFAYLCVVDFCTARKEVWVDEYVTGVVVEALSDPGLIERLADADRSADAQTALAEVAQLRARLDEHIALSVRGEISAATMARIEQELTPKIEAAEARARVAVIPPALREVARPDIADVWPDLPLSTRREVISSLMDIRLLPGRTGRRTFDPASIEITWKA